METLIWIDGLSIGIAMSPKKLLKGLVAQVPYAVIVLLYRLSGWTNDWSYDWADRLKEWASNP